ncbi:MAG: hypothetical protein HQM12_15925 [SAR324 cluster bacterium]|nr:hypothetical protein [SAR324 cluster bacterium]
MLAVKGTYQDGKVTLQEVILTVKPVAVIVTFLEEVSAPSEKKLNLEKFSFRKSQKLLEDYHGSLSDAVVEERRSAL